MVESAGWRPKAVWKSAAVKDVAAFSLSIAGFNLVNYFSVTSMTC